MEIIARNQYTGKDDKDPVACTLFYLALKKKKLLLGLWRTAHGHAEQGKMVTFLANDFDQDRWKTAALKNAFALLGKQRFCKQMPKMYVKSFKENIKVMLISDAFYFYSLCCSLFLAC